MPATSRISHYILRDRFFPQAKGLRAQFDRRFGDPRAGASNRFVWDYWHVPGQYTLVRTPAQAFFERKSFERFQQALLKFGRERLGCTGITPPWLSYYVEGCRQEVHADVPHGPWAFVFSLTPWKSRAFTGGETLIFKPSTLDYWRSFAEFRGVEREDLVETVPAEFNRLLVFDPRVPHGVTEVRGTHDPREARLVVHGWFTDPQPTVVGALGRDAASRGIGEILDRVDGLVSAGRWHGVLSLRLQVSASGEIRSAQTLASTLRSLGDGDPDAAARLEGKLLKAARASRFPRCRGASSVTLPLVFRWGD
jgi:hypothetical protein